MDDQQRAFRAGMDGCRDNTVLLDTLLRSRYHQFMSTFAATLDLARAFDSVEHSAIMRAAEAASIPHLLIKYLKNLYTSSTTTLSGTDWSSEPIKVTRGVKQGYPLSPVIFNLVYISSFVHFHRNVAPSKTARLFVPWLSRTIWFYSPTCQSVYNIYSTGRVPSWVLVAFS